MDLKELMRSVSIVFEMAGVLVILGGFGLSVVRGAGLILGHRADQAYTLVRRLFGRSVLLGLEVLVAADLIRTIAVEPTLDNLYVLGFLVAIRTFLSWSLDVELEGVWPWKKREVQNQEQER